MDPIHLNKFRSKCPSALGRKLSQETKNKISIANKGTKHTDSFKELKRQQKLGIKLSYETRLKMSFSAKKRWQLLKKNKDG